MSPGDRQTEIRIQRLLRWYPRAWRERYGEEFALLLVDDLGERPRSWRRAADIATSGLTARLSVAGLGAGALGQPAAALAVAGVAMATFLACGVSLWSQLLVGWRLSPPDSHAVTLGVVVMSVAVAGLAMLALLAAAPVGAAAFRALRHGEARRLLGPLALIAIGAAILIVGGHHVEPGWPGSAGHPWRQQWLVPSRLAGFAWAETMAITTYWAHPADLLALPRTQLGWTVVSPITAIMTAVGVVRLVRRITWSPAALAHEARLAKVAAAAMVPYLGAAAWWVVTSHLGAQDVFRAGSLDLLLIACMAAALAVARNAIPRMRPVGAS